MSNVSIKHGVIYQVKYKNGQVNEIVQKDSIICRKMLMLQKKMLRCFVIQPSFHHCNFGVHTQNHTVSEG